MKLLIPTEPDDTHAIVVKLAMEELGHQVILFFTADQPTKQRNSVFIDNHNLRWRSSNKFYSILNDKYDVVWWRRARKPHVPTYISHHDDIEFVNRENDLFFESFTSIIAPDAWWINNKVAARRANYKLLQLKIAHACGLQIPTTLCSNDPKEIQDFVHKHNTSGVIYKPLCSNFWFEKEQVKISYTARITPEKLPNYKILQQTPGIFQKEIKKKYELRITCFGNYIVAAKINSQDYIDGQIDWRAIRSQPIIIEHYNLPHDLAQKIKAFMRALDIVFGSLDFIVTEDGEYIFLEVNEQGQFLWIEELNSNMQMLDIFINFILNKSPNFTWKESQAYHSINKYREKISFIYQDNMQKHVSLNFPQQRGA